MTTLLSKSDILQHFDLHKMIHVFRQSLMKLRFHQAVSPLRQVHMLNQKPLKALGYMPSHMSGQFYGAKLASVHKGVVGSNLDSHQGSVMLFDDLTGKLLCIADGATVTALRTVAVSCLAAITLQPNTKSILIYGCGVQAKLHAFYLSKLFGLSKIIFHTEHVDEFAKIKSELSSYRIESKNIFSTGEDTSRFDLICTVTSANRVVVKEINEGSVVIAVGACTKKHRELSVELVTNAKIFADNLEAVMEEAGDLKGVQCPEVYDLAEVLECGFESQNIKTIFKRDHFIFI